MDGRQMLADVALGLQILRIYATDEVQLGEDSDRYLYVRNRNDNPILPTESQRERLLAASWRANANDTVWWHPMGQ